MAVDKRSRSNFASWMETRGYRHQESSVKLGKGRKNCVEFWIGSSKSKIFDQSGKSVTIIRDFFQIRRIYDIRKIGKGSDKSWYKKNLPINQTRNVFHNKSILQLRSTRYVISRGFSRVVKPVPPTDFHRTTRNLVLHRANDYREEKNPRERKEKRRKGEEKKKEEETPCKTPVSIIYTRDIFVVSK